MKIIPRRIFQLTTALTRRGASADAVVFVVATNSAHDFAYHSIAYYQKQQKQQQKLQQPQQRTLSRRSSLVVVGLHEPQQICLPSSLIIAYCSAGTSILNNYCLKQSSQVESTRILITGHTKKFSCSSSLSRYCSSTVFSSRIRCCSSVVDCCSLCNSYTRNSATNRFVYFGKYPRNFYTSTVDNMGWPSEFDEDCKVFFSPFWFVLCVCL